MLKLFPDFAEEGIILSLYYREQRPTFSGTDVQIEQNHCALRDCLDPQGQQMLMELVDDQSLVRELSSQYYYQKGFRLGVLTMLECLYAKE